MRRELRAAELATVAPPQADAQPAPGPAPAKEGADD